MAWNPKTKIGKVLKGAVTAAPLALALIPGIGPVVSAVATTAGKLAAKGTEKLKGAATILDGISAAAVADPVQTNTAGIVNGTRSAENAAKIAERDALINGGVVVAGTKINTNSNLLIGGAALVGAPLLGGKKRRR